jgi:hypothetical protein
MEFQQLLIDTYRDGHFKTIQYTEKLLQEYKRQFAQVKDAKLKKKYKAKINGVENELRALRIKTQKVLRDVQLLQKSLDSLK